VAVAALARMLELDKERPGAIEKLRALAKGRDLAAVDAQRALAMAKDASVAPQIEIRAKAKSAEERSQAAVDFARLGDATRVAALLGDQDAMVRSSAACAILGMDD
jgi:HEAT repeat protein